MSICSESFIKVPSTEHHIKEDWKEVIHAPQEILPKQGLHVLRDLLKGQLYHLQLVWGSECCAVQAKRKTYRRLLLKCSCCFLPLVYTRLSLPDLLQGFNSSGKAGIFSTWQDLSIKFNRTNKVVYMVSLLIILFRNDRKLYLLYLAQYRDRNWTELSGKQKDIQLKTVKATILPGWILFKVITTNRPVYN